MLLFCPACQATFPGASRCPRCGGILLMPHEVAPNSKRRIKNEPATTRPTFVSRLIVGVVLSLACYLAVRKLAIGVVCSVNPDPSEWWLTPTGMMAVQAVQAAAVVFGAMIGAAGQSKGGTLGGIVGVVCGGLFIGYELMAGVPVQTLGLYLQLPVLAAFGLIGGLVGGKLWGAPPTLMLGIPGSGKLSSLQLNEVVEAERRRPTDWARVLIGTTIMVAGVTAAEDIRLFVQRYSGGIFHSRMGPEGDFLTWQLATLIALVGAMVAGAGTGAGARHGLIAGMFGALGVYGLCSQRGDVFPALKYWLEKLSIPLKPITTPETIAVIVGTVALLGLIGGWMGGSLFQPIVPEHMRRGRHYGFD
ncbi:MAG: hypothetical protein K8U57_30730 [Planctomycetes bacterium]|nr:hypothetical protein [Planctomycetota bacterium]